MATTAIDYLRHPDWINPELDLLGVDDNAFAVMGTVRKALKRAGNDPAVVDAYTKAAQAGDF